MKLTFLIESAGTSQQIDWFMKLAKEYGIDVPSSITKVLTSTNSLVASQFIARVSGLFLKVNRGVSGVLVMSEIQQLVELLNRIN